MMKSVMDVIKAKIEKLHEGDRQQLKVIFSENDRIMVEAPAGYGKTTTVISRLAYLLSTNKIAYPKKILALTFSVNAALKVKRDVSAKLPLLMGVQDNPNYVAKKLTITNYHGFCKGILKKYGYLLSGLLHNLDELQAIADEDIFKLADTKMLLSANERLIVEELNDAIKNGLEIDNELMLNYNAIVIGKIIPQSKITHNSIISITLELFAKYPSIQKFYSSYFSLIAVDEFQDTNIIAWKLVHSLINPNTKLLFVGDSLQRIYGFIGAYQEIMEKSSQMYNMEVINLDKNYRFRYNPEMLKLDNNIRKNASNFNNPGISDTAQLPCHFAVSQQEEAAWISAKVKTFLQATEDTKVAVLVKNRGINTDIIEAELKNKGIDYFYALYKDDDEEYVGFHRKCLEVFNTTLQKKNTISRELLKKFADNISEQYRASQSEVHKSLVKLLYALVDKIMVDYINLESEERKLLLKDILENRQLKQAMEYISTRVILGTVHSAKGLEWDYVLLADVEKYIIPFFTTCEYCSTKKFSIQDDKSCKIVGDIDAVMGNMLLEELCVFYVAITRARKQVYISSSKERFNGSGRKFTNSILSCLPCLNGISLVKE